MKGKRLYQLISELNRSEHHCLINDCKASADKRAIALGDLLRKRSLTATGFQKWLQQLVESWKITDPQEQDRKQRRWVDFACKEVENMLLKNRSELDDTRYFQLSGIFDQRNHAELTAYYNELAIHNAEKHHALNNLIIAYDIELRWLSRNQSNQNVKKIGNLLQKRKEVTERAYHTEMSYFYGVSSSLYIDNPGDEAYQSIIPGKNEFEQLQKKATDEYSRILYALAETRFNFYNRKKFEALLQTAFNMVEHCGLDERAQRMLERNCRYLSITGALYYGAPVPGMVADAKRMLEIMLVNNLHDTVGFFFLLFFLLIDNDLPTYEALLKKHKQVFFTEDENDYLFFLKVFHLYRKGDTGQALRKLLQFNYSGNPYVGAWSRLLEIHIYVQQGDTRLAQLQIERAKRFLKSNRAHKIIYDPVLYTLQNIERQLENKPLPAEKPVFEYYKLMS